MRWIYYRCLQTHGLAGDRRSLPDVCVHCLRNAVLSLNPQQETISRAVFGLPFWKGIIMNEDIITVTPVPEERRLDHADKVFGLSLIHI